MFTLRHPSISGFPRAWHNIRSRCAISCSPFGAPGVRISRLRRSQIRLTKGTKKGTREDRVFPVYSSRRRFSTAAS